MQTTLKQKRGLIIKIAITACLVGWIIYTWDFSGSIETLQKLSIYTIISVIFLNTLFGMIAPIKWKILLPQYKFLNLWGLSYTAVFYSLVFPGQLGGEIAKIYILGKGKKDAQQIAASVMVDKITGIIGLLMVGITGMLLSHQNLHSGLLVSFTVILFISIVCLFSLRVQLFYKLVLKALLYMQQRSSKLGSFFGQIIGSLDSWHEYSKKKKVLLVSILLGCLNQLSAIITFVILAKNLEIEISYVDWCWIITALSIILLLPFTIAGIGIREGTLVGILSWMGISSQKALALSFAIFGLQIFLGIIGGIIDLSKTFKS